MRIILIAISLLMTTTAATAQTAADRADARCILVLTLAGQNPAQKEAAGRGQFYYYGRVASRGTATKLSNMLLNEAKAVTTPSQLQAELARCTTELTAANTSLRDGIKEVQAAAQQAAPPK
jgi:hypothetical protein